MIVKSYNKNDSSYHKIYYTLCSDYYEGPICNELLNMKDISNIEKWIDKAWEINRKN